MARCSLALVETGRGTLIGDEKAEDNISTDVEDHVFFYSLNPLLSAEAKIADFDSMYPWNYPHGSTSTSHGARTLPCRRSG